MSNYTIIKQRYLDSTSEVIERTDADGIVWSIPSDPANSDYQAYLAWVAEGNQVDLVRPKK